MSVEPVSRRFALKQLGIAGTGMLFAGRIRGETAQIVVAGQRVEIAIWSLSPATVRISVCPLEQGTALPVPGTGALVEESGGTRAAAGLEAEDVARVRAGDLMVRFTDSPPTLWIETPGGERIQQFTMDAVKPGLSFLLGSGPLLGFGEGGAQFDRRGAVDSMRNGQGARSTGPGPYRLDTHGTRAPVQWLIGTQDGWAFFLHQPYGSFDLSGEEGRFTPREETPLPLDLFVIRSTDPKTILREYARITGLPEMPPRWAFGYMQSSRTLAGPDEILGVARTFREKNLPCDALIYLGTEFAPSGWNTRNGEFTWHTANFPEPEPILEQLHDQHFRVIVHIVIEGRTLTGSVHDACTAEPLPPGRTEDDRWPPDRQVACYWPAHKPLMDAGVDGFWPDQGDGFDGPSRLNRHRMYWEGMQLDRPGQRPFALHRNASPGVQRFGGFIWSGDPRSRWETLATHVAVAINTGLSGFPYWGSDIGGFNPTDEYTGELHARWFQFGAFCASFRAHGRNWHLKLPWGWNGGDGGPFEARDWRANPAELNNPAIEPILRKFLELRYRLMPYLYTAVRQTHDTGLPLMRALWIHDPADEVGNARGDEYLWGPDLLIAPVTRPAATRRSVYLPRGDWFDFWTDLRVTGGRTLDRDVDLSIIPIYVRAGTVLPLAPVHQYAGEATHEPLSLVVYPGSSRTSFLYDDDGISFAYRDGAFMRLAMDWNDAERRLRLSLVPGSRMMPPSPRSLLVRLAGTETLHPVAFSGEAVEIRL